MSTNNYSPKFGPVAGGNFITFSSPTLDYASFPPTGATIHGVACTGGTLISPASYRFTVPAEAFSDVARDVVLTAPFGAVFPASYVYITAPICAVASNDGANPIGLTGHQFTATITSAASPFTFNRFVQGGGTYVWTKQAGGGVVTFDDNTIPTPTLGFSLAGVYTIRCTATNSIGTSFADVVVTVKAIVTISTVTPGFGTIAGGNVITITGNNFLAVANGGTALANVASVSIDGVNCTNLVIVDNNTITCKPAAHAFNATHYSVVVTGDTVATLLNAYYYITSPVADNGIVSNDIYSLIATTLTGNVKTTGAVDFSTFLSAGGTVQWTSSAGILNTPNNLITVFTPPGRGTYTIRLTATNNLGSTFEENVVNFHGIPVVNAGADDVAGIVSGYNLQGSATDL